MKYEEPSIVVLAAPAEVIQGAGKGFGLQEVAGPDPHFSIGAYEADE